jgi:hypothetical protein
LNPDAETDEVLVPAEELGLSGFETINDALGDPCHVSGSVRVGWCGGVEESPRNHREGKSGNEGNTRSRPDQGKSCT